MAFLRIATFEIEGAPGDVLATWDDLMGSALGNNPDCLTAIASHRDGTYAVVTTWTSESAFKTTMESKPYLDLLTTVAARLGLPDDYEPTVVFEGDIA